MYLAAIRWVSPGADPVLSSSLLINRSTLCDYKVGGAPRVDRYEAGWISVYEAGSYS